MQCTQNMNQNIEFVNIHFRLSCYQKTTLTGDKKSQDGFSPYFFKGVVWICHFLHKIRVRSVNWAPRNQENKVGVPQSTRSFTTFVQNLPFRLANSNNLLSVESPIKWKFKYHECFIHKETQEMEMHFKFEIGQWSAES